MQNLGEILAGTHAVVLFFILMAFLALGDFLATKSKALIPSILVFALLLLLTSWAGLIPKNIAELAGVGSVIGNLMLTLMVINMGTSLNLKDIISNWKTAIIAVCAVIGVAFGIVVLGNMVFHVFDWQTAVVSAPAVSGGIVAAMEMKGAAEAIGKETLATMAVLILTLQSFPAFLSMPTLLKKYMKKQLSLVDVQEWKASFTQASASTEDKCIVPEKYLTAPTILMMLSGVGVLSYLSFLFTKLFMGQYAISTMIFALIYSCVLTELKVLPRNALNKAVSNGLVLALVFVSAFASLALSDRAQVLSLLGPILLAIGFGILGIVIISVIVGKIFKYDWRISICIGLNCLLGFPINYQLTMESINGLTDNEDERLYLRETVLPVMLVAGFVTVTLGSVFLAGIMKGLL